MNKKIMLQGMTKEKKERLHNVPLYTNSMCMYMLSLFFEGINTAEIWLPITPQIWPIKALMSSRGGRMGYEAEC